MKGYIGEIKRNTGEIIADPEILFEFDDERQRDTFRQFIQNVRALEARVTLLEKRLLVVEEVQEIF
tara:strand:+ start:1360 stop:1557 length:198 start_codon:yes stop_codon:yes gene_type:complete